VLNTCEGVNPGGILHVMANGNGTCSYVHTEANQVQYFTAYRDGNENRKFHPCKPQMFHLGDIVQAQLSFVVIPIKGGHCKMLTVLQSLAMVDGNFRQV
ncbi:hypothetical protein L208DRAFT_1305509, partial [Tricholoma matsutake]